MSPAVVLIAAGTAFAHVPQLPRGGETFKAAIVVQDAAKSWAICAKLHEVGEAAYFKLELRAGDRLCLQGWASGLRRCACAPCGKA